jgi:hypothetical protein
MTTIPMFDVIPVSGLYQGERLCYVCKLGGEPVLALFIKLSELKTSPLLAAVEELRDEHPELQVFVVCLSAHTPALEQELRELAASRELRVPLVLLPTNNLPPSLPVDPAAADTILLYRGRQLKKKFENTGARLRAGESDDLFRDLNADATGAARTMGVPPMFNALAADDRPTDPAAAPLQSLRSSTQDLLSSL